MEKDYRTWIPIGCATLGTLTFNLLSLSVLLKTKRTPRNTHFLSAGLIILDSLALLTLLVRCFLTDASLQFEIMVDGMIFVFTGVYTVTLMCIERMLNCVYPLLYVKYIKRCLVKKLGIATWIISPVLFLFVQYEICKVIIKPVPQQLQCATYQRRVMFASLCLNIVISYACAIKIYWTIKHKIEFIPNEPNTCSVVRIRKTDKENVKEGVMKDQSTLTGDAAHRVLLTNNQLTVCVKKRNTYLVFAYLITVTVMCICAIIVNVTGTHTNFTAIISCLIILLNGIVDPCLYVFWFRESRLELMRTLALCFPSLKGNVEAKRLKLFEIVTRQ